MELFIRQGDGKKIVDCGKQNALTSRLQMELSRPLRVALISRGPDTELLVANPVELSGKGRPLVFYDITLTLKKLNRPIFSVRLQLLHAKLLFYEQGTNFTHYRLKTDLILPYQQAEIGRYMIGDREWEVYRVLLDEGDGCPFSKKAVEETVWKMLMSWE